MSYVNFYEKKRNKRYGKILKFFFIVFTVFIVSLFMQKKYDILYKIVYLENMYLHKEAFKVTLSLKKIDKKLPLNIYSLKVNAFVEFSKSPKYNMEILIPNNYIIIKNKHIGTISYKGNIYKKLLSTIRDRKYRDLISNNEILIYSDKKDIPSIPIIASIKKGDVSIFRIKNYSLSVKAGEVFLSK